MEPAILINLIAQFLSISHDRSRRGFAGPRPKSPWQSPKWLAGHAVPACRDAPCPCNKARARDCLPAIRYPERGRVSEASIPDRLGYAPAARREHVPLAIVYMIGATAVFAASSAASKWLVESYPIGEVLFTRTAAALLGCSLFILPRTGLAVFRTRRLSHHVMRSVSQAFSQTFLLIAFSLMPLAAASAINFSAPLFTALISALLLKEAVGLTRWA